MILLILIPPLAETKNKTLNKAINSRNSPLFLTIMWGWFLLCRKSILLHNNQIRINKRCKQLEFRHPLRIEWCSRIMRTDWNTVTLQLERVWRCHLAWPVLWWWANYSGGNHTIWSWLSQEESIQILPELCFWYKYRVQLKNRGLCRYCTRI